MNWRQALGILAGEFNFSAVELLNFTDEDLSFWVERLNDYQEWMEKSNAH